jgi:hypothetical protein
MIRRFGQHSLQIDGDMATFRFCGEMSLDEIKFVIAELDGMIAIHGRFGVLADLRELRSITPEARRFGGSWKNVSASYGSAAFGASLAMSTILSLLSRAMQIFMRTSDRGPLQFFKTEEEALAWLISQRERMLGK